MAITGPAQGQDGHVELAADAAIECGIRISYLGGLLEAEDPEAAEEYRLMGATWMVLGLTRLGGDETAFDAMLASETGSLDAEVAMEEDEEAALDLLLFGAAGCEFLKEGVREEFDTTYAQLAEE
jgi:hypothetical protein